MKDTKLKISVSQDGLLPEEVAEVASFNFPNLPKRLLRALGFEKIDDTTYVGVLPVFVNLGGKEQEIEIELGVSPPEMRKKVIEIMKSCAQFTSTAKVLKFRKSQTNRRKDKGPQGKK